MLSPMQRRHWPWAAALMTTPRCWAVGAPGGPATWAEALRLAGDGDTVRLPAGVHRAGGVVTQRALTVQGEGQATVLDGAGLSLPEGKALLVVRGGEVTVQDLHLRGARAPDGNGAGIRFERGRLTVRRCRFSDCEMGLLTGNDPTARLTVQDCRFDDAPPDTGRGLHHLLYIGAIAEATVTGSDFRFGARGAQGHLLKCRARVALVAHNRLGDDDPRSTPSYLLDFSNGGRVTVRGNRLVQGPASPNRTLLAYGPEGGGEGREHCLTVHGNHFVNRGRPALFWRVWASRLASAPVLDLADNRREGAGRAEPEPPGAWALTSP
jgi:hypothetical protein